jgi:hypothetical protein
MSLSRRSFLNVAPGLALVPSFGLRQTSEPDVRATFPAQDPEVVREIVSVSHGNLARVKELVTARPALARAGWDWGFGDWETAIDAASHMGNRPIAEFLIGNGARPTIFTAAMLGHLGVVKGLLESIPGVQRNRGPHGITLLAHARAGGAAAVDVVRYLEALGDADPRYTNVPLSDADQTAVAGDYAFGTGSADRFRVGRNTRGDFTIARTGMIERNIFHHGGLVFHPSGAEAVTIRFEVTEGRAHRLILQDGALVVNAARIP